MTRENFLRGMWASVAVATWWGGKGSAQVPLGGYEIEELQSNRPAFGRVYRGRVNENVSLKIEMKWFLGGDRFTSGELVQGDGRWVLFEPKRAGRQDTRPGHPARRAATLRRDPRASTRPT